MAVERKSLTKDEVMGWRENWSESDRRLISSEIERLGVKTYEVPPNAGYIHGLNGDSRSVLVIHPGYVEFAPGSAPEGAIFDPSDSRGYLTLSTFRARGAGVEGPRVNQAECPRHPGIALPLSGVCDDCD